MSTPSSPLGCTVLIVEDESKVRHAYRRILEAEGYATVVANSLADASRLFEDPRLRFDVAVLDLRLPDGCGCDLVGPLLRRHSACRSLILSGLQDQTAVARALEAGAHEFLPKPVSPRELVDHVDIARRSARSWRSALAWATGGVQPPSPLDFNDVSGAPTLAQFTDAQREVLSLLEQGLSNGQMADLLHISQSTVRKHVSSVLSKLELQCRSQVPARALQRVRGQTPDLDD